ncbi:MAG: MarR family transcriptional regulator [Candidatus Bathyarchaeota archaeon]|nr:MarR family transcriptional regulator [Candidatus Bathyarchaeota archaeon]
MAVTAVAAYEYYRQIRMAHKEYVKARDFIQDIVLSFDRQLKRESNRFESMVAKVDGTNVSAESSYRKAENLERKLQPLQEQLSTLSQSYQAMSQSITENLTESSQASTTILSGLEGLESKLKDIEATQETLRNKISGFEEQIQKLSIARPLQPQVEVALPPIPIKRDKALSALTETEITVLEMLSKEGPKTAPEIKEHVKLSREHTARLMKKLYEEGYLEREAGKIPFRYSIKKEMEPLLARAENPAV